MKIKIARTHPETKIPKYSRDGDGAWDIYSPCTITIPKEDSVIIPANFAMIVPPGHIALLWDRGGMAAKNHVQRIAGLIDANYRGEVMVVLHNLGHAPYTINKGDKIVQMFVVAVPEMEAEEIDMLELLQDKTERGEGRFTSSGA